MKIKTIIDAPDGKAYKKGEVLTVSDGVGKRMIDMKRAVEDKSKSE